MRLADGLHMGLVTAQQLSSHGYCSGKVMSRFTSDPCTLSQILYLLHMECSDA